MKDNKYLIISIILVIILIVYIISNETSARFTSTGSGSSTARVARFAVDVSSLVDGELKSFEDDLKLEAILDTNQGNIIKEGKMAPGFMAKGAFVLDTTGTEVATIYKVHVGAVEYGDVEYDDFILYSVKASYIDSEGEIVEEKLKIETVDDGTECIGEISLENADKPITFEVTVLWNYIDDPENILGIEEAELTVPIEVTVKQVD